MEHNNQIENLENRIAELEKENLLLHEKVYGSTTEQTSSLGLEGQMSLFDEAEVSGDPKAAEPDLKDVASYRCRKHKGQKEELLKDLPHENKLCTLAEEDRFCETCGTPLVSVWEEFVRTEIEFIPAKVRVIDYYPETFECRKCRKEGKEYMEKSPMPYPVIQHSYAFPGSVT